jgi:hypothetical protein
MRLTFLSYIFFTGGIIALLYAILALLSLLDHLRAEKKAMPGNYKPGAELQATKGSPATAEALWERTKIFLQNEQFDAALADCKRVLAINPNHAAAKRLWNHLFPPELASHFPAGNAFLLAADTEKTGFGDKKTVHE